MPDPEPLGVARTLAGWAEPGEAIEAYVLRVRDRRRGAARRRRVADRRPAGRRRVRVAARRPSGLRAGGVPTRASSTRPWPRPATTSASPPRTLRSGCRLPPRPTVPRRRVSSCGATRAAVGPDRVEGRPHVGARSRDPVAADPRSARRGERRLPRHRRRGRGRQLRSGCSPRPDVPRAVQRHRERPATATRRAPATGSRSGVRWTSSTSRPWHGRGRSRAVRLLGAVQPRTQRLPVVLAPLVTASALSVAAPRTRTARRC